MEKSGVSLEELRPEDYDIAPGVWPDMKEHVWEKDDWPEIYEKVKKANVLVTSSPIWLGDKSSVCTEVIERLYSTSSDLNEAASTPTTDASAVVSSPATRTGSSTAR
jgi:multimeric flavodoxin WrbA